MDDFTKLLKKTWNIYGISILFDFQYEDEVLLKQYAKKLREEVATILSQDNVSYDAKITVLDWQRPKETDHPVVMIEVFANVLKENSSVKNEKSVYEGYLISWESKESKMSLKNNSTQLPLLLCRGTPNTMRAVHTTINWMFDCTLLTLPANSEDLRWLLSIFFSPGGGYDEPNKQDKVELKFIIPGSSKSDAILVKFFIKDVIKLWKSFLKENNEIQEDDIEDFHDILQNQVLNIGGLKLGLCELHKINMPLVTISESKMKVMDLDMMDAILRYFCKKSIKLFCMNVED